MVPMLFHLREPRLYPVSYEKLTNSNMPGLPQLSLRLTADQLCDRIRATDSYSTKTGASDIRQQKP